MEEVIDQPIMDNKNHCISFNDYILRLPEVKNIVLKTDSFPLAFYLVPKMFYNIPITIKFRYETKRNMIKITETALLSKNKKTSVNTLIEPIALFQSLMNIVDDKIDLSEEEEMSKVLNQEKEVLLETIQKKFSDMLFLNNIIYDMPIFVAIKNKIVSVGSKINVSTLIDDQDRLSTTIKVSNLTGILNTVFNDEKNSYMTLFIPNQNSAKLCYIFVKVNYVYPDNSIDFAVIDKSNDTIVSQEAIDFAKNIIQQGNYKDYFVSLMREQQEKKEDMDLWKV